MRDDATPVQRAAMLLARQEGRGLDLLYSTGREIYLARATELQRILARCYLRELGPVEDHDPAEGVVCAHCHAALAGERDRLLAGLELVRSMPVVEDDEELAWNCAGCGVRHDLDHLESCAWHNAMKIVQRAHEETTT